MRSLWTLLLLAAPLLVACGSNPPELLILEVPPTSGVGGGGAGQPAYFPSTGGGTGGGGVEVDPVVFDDSVIDLGRAGGYPSDLAADSKGTLYTVDDALVPCKVLAYPSDGGTAPIATVAIGPADLIDMDGSTPARSVNAFGAGLFGAYTGDLAIVFNRWLLVTVGAGNSISFDANGPLYLANLVVIDTWNRKVVQTVNLAWPLPRSGSFAGGGNFGSVTQSMPVSLIFLPTGDGTTSGTLHVAMSNGMGDNYGLSDYFPGTVQEWAVDFRAPEPVSAVTSGTVPGEITRTYFSKYYNPVALSGYVAADGRRCLILTAAGGSRFDANYVLQPLSSAHLEFLDLESNSWQPNWEINLGPILPSVAPLAHGSDGNGVQFALLTSQTFAAVYVVELTGLESNPVDTSCIRLLRSTDLTPGGASQAGSGFQPGIAVTPSGRTALVTAFNSSSLSVLALPSDIEYGQITIDPVPFDTVNLVSSKHSGLGALAILPGASADAYFVVNGTFTPNYTPAGSAFVGTLTVPKGLP